MTYRTICALTLCAFAIITCGGTARAGVAEDYDAAVQSKKNPVQITFGHDVDLKGKAWEYAKTLVDKAELPWDSINKFKSALLNATDFWKDTHDNGLTAEEFNRFVLKTMLDSLSPKDVVRIKRTFRLSNKMTQRITKYGIGVLEGASEGAGEIREGDAGGLETALLAAVDTVCAECAVARGGALLAFEAAKEVEAWIHDETTQMQYDAWKDRGLLLTTAGFGPTMVAARRALEAIYESQGRTKPPTSQEVEQFIKYRFESWKRIEEAAERDANVLDEAKDDYLKLTDVEREGFGGRTEQEHAAAFADAFLPIYNQLISLMGSGHYPPGGRDRLLQDAVMLAHVRASDGEGAYRDRMFDTLRNYGWIAAIPPGRKEAIKNRLVERLSHLSFANLKTFFDYAQLNQTEAFYGCLCASLPGVGIGKKYEPSGGGPCHLFGLGDWSEPFPKDEKAWRLCLTQTTVGDQSFADHLAERIIHWQAVK